MINITPGQLYDFGGVGYIVIDSIQPWGEESYVQYHFTADEDEYGSDCGMGCEKLMSKFLLEIASNKLKLIPSSHH